MQQSRLYAGIGGVLLILLLLASFVLRVSKDQALRDAHAPATVTFIGLDPIDVPDGEIVWYEADGVHHVAWLARRLLSWQVRAQRPIPTASSADQVAWTVWSPNGQWSLVFGSFPVQVTEITVNQQRASLGDGVWWFYTDSPLNPPLTISAYNRQHDIVWKYPESH